MGVVPSPQMCVQATRRLLINARFLVIFMPYLAQTRVFVKESKQPNTREGRPAKGLLKRYIAKWHKRRMTRPLVLGFFMEVDQTGAPSLEGVPCLVMKTRVMVVNRHCCPQKLCRKGLRMTIRPAPTAVDQRNRPGTTSSALTALVGQASANHCVSADTIQLAQNLLSKIAALEKAQANGSPDQEGCFRALNLSLYEAVKRLCDKPVDRQYVSAMLGQALMHAPVAAAFFRFCWDLAVSALSSVPPESRADIGDEGPFA